MIDKRVTIGFALLLALFWGCQTTTQAPMEKDKQANAYVTQAQAYESQGNLVEALEQYKLAQAMDPDEPMISDSISRIEGQLQQQAEIHYQAGLRFRDKGKWDLAKKEFLKALVYWPTHEKAAAMLQQREPEGSRAFITHVIGPGESISKLALKYYGDYRKYHHIANFNNMTDATQVRVGQKIMVPVIAGVTIDDLNRISSGMSPSSAPDVIDGDYVLHTIAPGESLSIIAKQYYGDYKLFRVIADYNDISDPTSVRVGQKVKVPRLTGDQVPAESDTPYRPEPEMPVPETPSPAPPEPIAQPSPETQPEPVDQVAEYRETGISLFNENNYDDAIVELQKVLNAAPDDAAAKGYIVRAFVEKGRQHLDAGRIDEAKTAFITALDYDSSCQPCESLLATCRDLESDALVAEGEKLYQANQFEKAIIPLERAMALNPDNRKAKDLLFQTHFQQALILYKDQNYLAAKKGFEKAVAVNPDCNDCRDYIENSLESYKEYHYNEGIVFFGREALKEAIAAWEKVEAVDPDYKDVKRNLEKARQLDERLERIKSGSD